MLEYVTTLIATLDRRFDSLHQDLKDSITQRFTAVDVQFAEKNLRDNQRFDAQKEAVAAVKEAVAIATAAAEKATTKAEAATEKRFDSVNEFRQTLSDQTATFLPRAEAEARMASLAERVLDLAARFDRTEGTTGGANIEKRLQDLAALVTDSTNRLDTNAGKTAGAKELWGYLVGAAGLILAVVAYATR